MISTSPKPTYPAELLSSKDTGTVRIRVVVTASGRAEMSTVQVIESPHPAFTRAVLDVLPSYEFIAAEVGGTLGGPCRRSGEVEICQRGKPGRKVSQPVDIAFVFSPPADPPASAGKVTLRIDHRFAEASGIDVDGLPESSVVTR